MSKHEESKAISEKNESEEREERAREERVEEINARNMVNNQKLFDLAKQQEDMVLAHDIRISNELF